jgi:hypothetical protein
MEGDGTQVMMLGRIGDVQIAPEYKVDWVHSASTYREPQNLLRPVVQNYPSSAFGVIYNVANEATLGKIGRFLGQANGPGNATPPATDVLAPPADANGQPTTYTVPVAVYAMLGTISAGASAYHGYRRNQSVGWAIWWAAMGYLAPVITPAIGLAQGWGKRAR